MARCCRRLSSFATAHGSRLYLIVDTVVVAATVTVSHLSVAAGEPLAASRALAAQVAVSHLCGCCWRIFARTTGRLTQLRWHVLSRWLAAVAVSHLCDLLLANRCLASQAASCASGQVAVDGPLLSPSVTLRVLLANIARVTGRLMRFRGTSGSMPGCHRRLSSLRLLLANHCPRHGPPHVLQGHIGVDARLPSRLSSLRLLLANRCPRHGPPHALQVARLRSDARC